MTRATSILGRIAHLALHAVLAVLGLATVGSFLPAVPALGELGPVLTAVLGPWFPTVSFVGAIAAYALWHKNGAKRDGLIALLGFLAAFGSGYILSRQIAAATLNGARIDLGQAFAATSQQDASLRPVAVNYAAFDGEQLPLELYRPAARSDGALAPVFVYVHGGGWGSQTLRQRQADYRWFAERGYLVVSLEYSLSSATRHTWNIATPQLGCALAWVNANASRYGGDASRLALWGESAGGNLVLNVSYLASQGKLAPSCSGTLPPIRATAALYPVVDPARMYRPVDPLLGVFGRMMGDNYTGGSPLRFPDRYTAIASATHISAKAPPTLLIIPEADHLVAPGAAYAFEARARAAGIATRLIRVPYAEHAFDLRSGGIGNQLVRQAMLRFLAEHGMAVPPG